MNGYDVFYGNLITLFFMLNAYGVYKLYKFYGDYCEMCKTRNNIGVASSLLFSYMFAVGGYYLGTKINDSINHFNNIINTDNIFRRNANVGTNTNDF